MTHTSITPEMIEAAEEAYMPFGDMGLAIQCALAAAPQPPEAAPVQLPEPVAKIEGGSLKWHIPDAGYSLPVRYLKGTQMLYTEHQLSTILAKHGIKTT